MNVVKPLFGIITLLGLVYLCVMVYLVVAGIADALLTILNSIGGVA
mgnify:CR=1 FL=1